MNIKEIEDCYKLIKSILPFKLIEEENAFPSVLLIGEKRNNFFSPLVIKDEARDKIVSNIIYQISKKSEIINHLLNEAIEKKMNQSL